MGTTNFSALSTDAGPVPAGTQVANIADASAVAAITATSPGAAYVQAEAVAVYNDVVALRATCADLRTKLNSAIAALEAFGIAASA